MQPEENGPQPLDPVQNNTVVPPVVPATEQPIVAPQPEAPVAPVESQPAEDSTPPQVLTTPEQPKVIEVSTAQDAPKVATAEPVAPEIPEQPAVVAPEAPVQTLVSPATAQPVVGMVGGDMPGVPASSPKPSLLLGILSIVFAFLVPIVGLVLGVLSTIKGFKKGNKKLGILGIIGIVISVIVGIAFAMLIMGVLNKAKFSGELVSYSNSACVSGSYSFSYPKEMTGKQENGKEILLWQPLAGDSSSQTSKDFSVSAINGVCEYLGVSNLTAAEKKQVEGALPDVAEGFKKGLEVEKFKNVKTTSFQPFTGKNISADAWVADVTGENVEGVPIRGQLVIVLGKSNIYAFGFVSQSSIWDLNKEVWAKVTDSIKVQ